MSTGALTPEEALTVAGVIELRRKAIETHEWNERLTALEAKAAETDTELLNANTAQNPAGIQTSRTASRRYSIDYLSGGMDSLGKAMLAAPADWKSRERKATWTVTSKPFWSSPSCMASSASPCSRRSPSWVGRRSLTRVATSRPRRGTSTTASLRRSKTIRIGQSIILCPIRQCLRAGLAFQALQGRAHEPQAGAELDEGEQTLGPCVPRHHGPVSARPAHRQLGAVSRRLRA